MMTGRDGCLPRANMLEARPGSARRWLHFSVLSESCCFTQQKTKPVPTVSDPAGCRDHSTDPSTSVQILAPGCLTEKNEEIWRLARKRFVFFTYLKLQIKCVCVFIRGWQVKLVWFHLDFCWLFLYILLFDVIEFSRSYWLALKQHYSFSQML